MFENSYCLYVHVNKINYKTYIGITSKKPKHRWDNGNGYINCPYFYKAIQKYGWNNFEHIVLAKNISKEFALKLEKFYIKKCNSHNEKYGYNCTTGGDFPTMRPETSDKKRKSMLHKNKGKNSPLSKPVICLETKERFDCLKQAEEKLNIDASSIGKVCKGKSIIAGGLHWLYEDDYIKLTDIEVCDIIFKKHKRKSGIIKKVKCIETNQSFDSIKSASIAMGLNPKRISDVVNNKINSTKGYHFIIEGEYNV